MLGKPSIKQRIKTAIEWFWYWLLLAMMAAPVAVLVAAAIFWDR